MCLLCYLVVSATRINLMIQSSDWSTTLLGKYHQNIYHNIYLHMCFILPVCLDNALCVASMWRPQWWYCSCLFLTRYSHAPNKLGSQTSMGVALIMHLPFYFFHCYYLWCYLTYLQFYTPSMIWWTRVATLELWASTIFGTWK